jgi:hypothetical protein
MGSKKKEKHVMKKLAIFASLLISATLARVDAADGCSNTDLRGVYSFAASGTIVSNPVKLPAGPFAAAGSTTYDGSGNASGVIEISLNGTIAPPLTVPPTPPSSWTGTYSMDPSTCTATKALTITSGPLTGVTLHFFITAGADFKELRFIATDNYTAISGTARKQ